MVFFLMAFKLFTLLKHKKRLISGVSQLTQATHKPKQADVLSILKDIKIKLLEHDNYLHNQIHDKDMRFIANVLSNQPLYKSEIKDLIETDKKLLKLLQNTGKLRTVDCKATLHMSRQHTSERLNFLVKQGKARKIKVGTKVYYEQI